MQRTLALLFAALVGAFTPSAHAAHTRATLLLSASSAQPGDTVLAGVRLQMDPGWHTYWKNPGDSGGPTKIEWQLPPGVTAGDIQWPLPEKLTLEELTTYVFHDEVILLVPLKLAADLKPGPLELNANVSWLECEKQCVQGRGQPHGPAANRHRYKSVGGSNVAGRWPEANCRNPRTGCGRAAPGKNRRPAIRARSSSNGQVHRTRQRPDFFPDLYDAFEVQSATEIVSGGADTGAAPQGGEEI